MSEVCGYFIVFQVVTKKSVKVVKAKSRKLLYMRAYGKLNDMEGMFSSENKNSPTGGGGVG